jgi:hypothetical protein
MLFEDWWQIVISMSDNGIQIRNWTAYNGYTVEGGFVARSYRAFTKAEQSLLNDGYPFSAPDDWLVCSQVKGGRCVPVSKKEFQDRYKSWDSYRDQKIIRKDFNASPYVISIFHRFDKLLNINEQEIVSIIKEVVAATKKKESGSDSLESK